MITSIEKGVTGKEMRLMARAYRQKLAVRRQLKASTVNAFVKHALPAGSVTLARLLPLAAAVEKTERDMEVDTPPALGQCHASQKQSVLPEMEIFCYLLVTIYLIDQKQMEEAKACSSASVKRLQQLNRRTLDVPAARVYYYYSYSHELTDSLSDTRG